MDLQEAMVRAIVEKTKNPRLRMLWTNYQGSGAYLRANGMYSWTWDDLIKELPEILKTEE